MNKIITLLTLFAFAACSNPDSSNTTDDANFGGYGDTAFSIENAISTEALLTSLQDADSVEAVVTGTVGAVCQAKGCWMSMPMDEDNSMRVTFKDYGFFVPKNAKDQVAYINGKAFVDTLSVAMLKEYAKDAEKSQEEIDAITEPEVEFSFVAEGVLFQ